MATTATFTATFTTAGTFTWVAPAGVSAVSVQAWGAGAGGGGTEGFAGLAGGGGGGGEYAAELSNTCTAGNSYTVVVGAVGAGGNTSGSTGGGGSNSTFTGTGATTVTAHGGSGGQGAAGTGAGGAGGTGSANTVHHNGGAGGNCSVTVGQGGGGGGGSGGTAAGGNTGTAGSSSGGGGAGAVTGGGPGGNGSLSSTGSAPASGPGGGGGGGGADDASAAGGAGFAGQVILTWTMPTPAVINAATTGGVYKFTDPAGITSVSWVISGTATFDGNSSSGNETVTPGNLYTITVAAASSLTINFSATSGVGGTPQSGSRQWRRRHYRTQVAGLQPLPVLSTGSVALGPLAMQAQEQESYPLIAVQQHGGRQWRRRFRRSQTLKFAPQPPNGNMSLGPLAMSGTGAVTPAFTGSMALGPLAMQGTEAELEPATGSVALGPLAITSAATVENRFPTAPLGTKIELLINGSWVDITGYAYQRSNIVITRGRPNETTAGTSVPVSMSLTLNNRDGSFSSRNPLGQFYGFIGLNTQIRLSISTWAEDGTPYSGYRFWGVVSEWPPSWDPTGTDVYVNIVANGVLRRLAQGAPLRSALYRYITGLANAPLSYWPGEDGSSATSLASGVSGGFPMTWTGSPSLASDTSFAASAAIPSTDSAIFTGQTGAAGAIPVANFAVFTNAGSSHWTAPSGVNAAVVQAWGGGGAGGGQNGSTGGGGGGGGEYSQDSVTLTPGSSYAYTVGSGSGGNTTFAGNGLTVTAHGGTSGDNAGNGGAGGTGSSNALHNDGGDGADGSGGPGGSGSTTPGSFASASPGTGSWEADSTITGSVQVYLWGAGAGGGGGETSVRAGGGGAGGNFKFETIGVTGGNSYGYTIGTGGSGGGGDADGSAGTASQFVGDSVTLTAHGGHAGLSGHDGGTGGAPASPDSGGTTVNFGGSGAGGGTTGAGGKGGGGGGGAALGGNGGSAAGQSAGGGGAAGGDTSGGSGGGGGVGATGGSRGSGPAGGGGGGGVSNSSGGGGANGRIELYWLDETAPGAAAVGGGGGSSAGSSGAGNSGATEAGGAAVTGGGPGGGTLSGSSFNASPTSGPGGGGGGYDSLGGPASGQAGQIVVTYASSGGGSAGVTANVLRFLLHVDAGGDTDGAEIARMYTTGTITYVSVIYNVANSGSLTLSGFNAAGAQLFTTGEQAWGVDGLLLMVSVELQTSGSNVTYQLTALQAGDTAVIGAASGTDSGAALGNPFTIVIDPNSNLASSSFGHIIVSEAYDPLTDYAAPLAGYAGEYAADRFTRLCTEEGVGSSVISNFDYDTLIDGYNPYAWWTLADSATSATAADSSGNGFTGSATDVTFATTGVVSGNTGAGFSGTPSGITSTANPSGGTLTVIAWVNLLNQTQTGNPRLVADAHTDAVPASGFELFFHSSTNLPYFACSNGTSEVTVIGNTPLPASGWTMLAATWDGTTVTLYFNGSPTQTGSLSGNLSTGQNGISLGYASTYNGDYLNGTLQEAAVFQSVLTGAEISQLFAAGYPGYFTELMGPQTPETLVQLLQECEDADRGLLYEDRNSLGLVYRPRNNLYNQTAALSLNYNTADLAQPLQPTEDDQLTRNDVTLSRVNGSSSEQMLTSGSYSTQNPPDGIGLYSYSASINVESDGQLADRASWEVYLGTADQLRYPAVTLDLTRTEAVPYFAEAAGMDCGDYVTVSNPPFWLPTGSIDQLAYGFTENLNAFIWQIAMNCVPETPYEVAVSDVIGNGSRVDTDGSLLHQGIGTGDTMFAVDTPAPNAQWVNTSENPAEFPFTIIMGGETMQVTGIDTSNPQNFTVERSINGIQKSHTAGESVNVYEPGVAAL